MAKIVSKKPGQALENGANVGSAFASRGLKAASWSSAEVVTFYHIGKGLYYGKFVLFYFI